ncbi:MAG TPA: POTRA domain-containing protein [Candidatus Acidoferrales bacterium]|nr:POTRA domain-containing protein [Candidatus Acidoferrales bacterium]
MALRLSPRHTLTGMSRSLILGAALVALLPAVVSAQTAATGPQTKLASVTQTGSHMYSSAQVASFGGLQVGATIGRDAIQAAANRLARSGLFSTVQFRFSTDASGLNVTFEVQDAETFPITLDNLPWITGEDLTGILTQAGIPGQTSAPASGTIDDAIAQALQKNLQAKNVNATVTYAVMPIPGTSDRVLAFKAAGADVRVASLQFSDPLAASDPAVKAQLPTIVGKPFSLMALDRFDFEQVRPAYLSHAYLHVKFSSPTIRFADSNSVNITVPIDPGPAFVWGGVAWNGNHAYTTSDLNALVNATGLTAGQPADGTKITAMWQSVRAAYGHRGYIDATVDPKETFDEAAHRASYQVNISEGDQYHMGNLVLTGLAVEAERSLRAAWRIPQGQVFDQTFCDYFLARGIAQALKGLPAAQDTVGHYLEKNAQQKTVDVMIDFQ